MNAMDPQVKLQHGTYCWNENIGKPSELYIKIDIYCICIDIKMKLLDLVSMFLGHALFVHQNPDGLGG